VAEGFGQGFVLRQGVVELSRYSNEPTVWARPGNERNFYLVLGKKLFLEWIEIKWRLRRASGSSGRQGK